MFWVKVMLDWGSDSIGCDECGAWISGGTEYFVQFDKNLEVITKKCPECYKRRFPEE